jgi:hypothetical protein
MISSPQLSLTDSRSAHYVATLRQLVAADDFSIIGALSHTSPGTVEAEQVGAWKAEIDILQTALNGLEGVIYLDFTIPRLGGRIDAVVLAGGAILPIEFKLGETHSTRRNIDQACDYALVEK